MILRRLGVPLALPAHLSVLERRGLALHQRRLTARRLKTLAAEDAALEALDRARAARWDRLLEGRIRQYTEAMTPADWRKKQAHAARGEAAARKEKQAYAARRLGRLIATAGKTGIEGHAQLRLMVRLMIREAKARGQGRKDRLWRLFDDSGLWEAVETASHPHGLGDGAAILHEAREMIRTGHEPEDWPDRRRAVILRANINAAEMTGSRPGHRTLARLMTDEALRARPVSQLAEGAKDRSIDRRRKSVAKVRKAEGHDREQEMTQEVRRILDGLLKEKREDG